MPRSKLASFDAPCPQAAVASAPASATQSAPAKTYFFLTADAEAGLLPRVLAPFVRLGLVPYRVHTSTEQGTGEEMSVELRFAHLPADRAEILAATCRGMAGMRNVLTVAEPE